MTSLMIVVTYLTGAVLDGSISQEPPAPQAGDTSIPIDGGSLPLQGAKKIQVIDDEDELLLGNPWWNLKIQFVDGMEGSFFLPEEPSLPLPPAGFVELQDADGHKVWVPEEAVSSATSNGPYWRG